MLPLIDARMAITVSLVVDVAGPWRSRKSEQRTTLVTPGLFFLAPCSVEEARTGCRLMPLEHSSTGEWTVT
jgi:hypothetical protein